MRKAIITLLIILPNLIIGQSNCVEYKNNYIPVDLNDATTYLTCVWPKGFLKKFKTKNEKDATLSLDTGIGRSIRNNWKLWAGTSQIAKYFENLGIHHAEDISNIIFISLHRNLNDNYVNLDEQIQSIKDYWAEIKRKETLRKKNKFSEYKVGDLVEFAYPFDFVSKSQEEKWDNDKCIANGIILELDEDKLELKINLKASCDRKGIILLKADMYSNEDGEWVMIEKDNIEIMNTGEERWSSYEYWDHL